MNLGYAQCCGAGPILIGSGSCGRLRITIINTNLNLKKYSFDKVNKFYFILSVPIVSFNLCKNCYNLTKIIRIVEKNTATASCTCTLSWCILKGSGFDKKKSGSGSITLVMPLEFQLVEIVEIS